MEKILSWVLAIFIAIIFFTYLVGEVTDKQTSRLYARAHLSEVRSESRKDLSVIFLPYVIIAVSLIAGVIVVVALTYGLIAVTAIWINRPLPPPPPKTEIRIIERQIIVMLRPNQSRRDYYQQLEKVTNQTYYR
ncbi:hypothetical protein LCGC14_2325790 [marine sediment metagenome]|uniref:Uncharacterized protein n=1 Tax=marine sediment metagenome TaxID=412755 RepID=A0A0F9CGH5_9ZZZZ